MLEGFTCYFPSLFFSLLVAAAANFFISYVWGSKDAYFSPSSANGFSIIFYGLFINLGDLGTVYVFCPLFFASSLLNLSYLSFIIFFVTYGPILGLKEYSSCCSLGGSCFFLSAYFCIVGGIFAF